MVVRTLAPLVVLYWCLAWFCSTDARAQEIDLALAQSLAIEGDRAYEDAAFDTAIEKYRAALDAGLDHAVVHYNLGNAHYKQGELGYAIASYLRALRRNPRDENARANLAQARTFLRDEAFVALDLPVFLRPVQWLYQRASLNEWAWLGLLGTSLASLVMVAGHWIPAIARRRVRLAGSFAVLAVFCFGFMGVHFVREELRTTAVVIAEEVDVRSGPGASYNLSFKIHEGLEVYVDDRRQDWVQIHLGGELVGWVRADEIMTL